MLRCWTWSGWARGGACRQAGRFLAARATLCMTEQGSSLRKARLKAFILQNVYIKEQKLKGNLYNGGEFVYFYIYIYLSIYIAPGNILL